MQEVMGKITTIADQRMDALAEGDDDSCFTTTIS